MINKFNKSRFPQRLTKSMIEEAEEIVQEQIARIMVGYSSLQSLPWYAYNEVARALDLGIRRATTGVIYYVA